MKRPLFRPWSDARLMAFGLLSGLVFLLVCVVRQATLVMAGAAPAPAASTGSAAVLGTLPGQDAELLFPVPAVAPSAMANSFEDHRGNSRIHRAVDILAPRHSPVVAVADGTVVRMMNSAAGGITLYQFSEDQRLCFYYAHLQGYAEDLKEGQSVKRGQVLGYVGTTGNAPARTPHLHFAIAEVEKKDQWWGGKAINPYPIWR